MDDDPILDALQTIANHIEPGAVALGGAVVAYGLDADGHDTLWYSYRGSIPTNIGLLTLLSNDLQTTMHVEET